MGISGGVDSRSVMGGRDGKRVSKSGTCERHGSHGWAWTVRDPSAPSTEDGGGGGVAATCALWIGGWRRGRCCGHLRFVDRACLIPAVRLFIAAPGLARAAVSASGAALAAAQGFSCC